MASAVPLFSPTLESVQEAFAQWRSNRQQRGHTPPGLQRRAVALMNEHRSAHICAALGINYQTLKRWAQSAAVNQPPVLVGTSQPPPDFIPLPSESPEHAVDAAPAVSVDLTLANGVTLSLSGAYTLEQIVAVACQVGASTS